MKLHFHILFIFFFAVAFSTCKKSNSKNPFDDPDLQPPDQIEESDNTDPESIVGLHKFIFSKTCANSGCHDGTFEPDFRTIESSYNTLIYHPLIKNDPQGSYTYRVLPGNADRSVLYQRLIIDIDGQSGIMPLVVDPGNDWNENKNEYINRIKNWINKGAPDMFGNSSLPAESSPQMQGTFAAVVGDPNSTYTRKPGKRSLYISAGVTSIDLYFAIKDDKTDPQDLTYNKVLFSENMNDFSGAAEEDLEVITPITSVGYFDEDVPYTHKITKDISAYPAETPVFFRIMVKDTGPEPTEMPKNGSGDYIKIYFSFIKAL